MKKLFRVFIFLALIIPPLHGAAHSAAAPLAAVANPGIIDDADLATWKYTGSWSVYRASRAYMRSFHVGRAAGSQADLQFNGERFELIFTRGRGFGSLDIYVDNVLQTSIDQSGSTTQFQQRWASPVFTDGLHDLRLVQVSSARVSVDGIQIFGPPDLTNPASISDLGAATGPTGGSVTLTFTAPGDDGATGTATSYLVRYAASAITDESAWDAAQSAVGIPAPKTAGSSESIDIFGLSPGITYYFAVRALDEASNMGDLSNSPSAEAKSSSPLTPGKYDERYANILYNGTWVSQNSFGAYSRTWMYSTLVGSSAAFMFDGTDFALTYTTSNVMGVMDVYIDGAFEASINQFSSTTKWQRSWVSPVLANGLHSVQLIHASGGRINLDAVQVKVTIAVDWPSVSFSPVVGGLNSPVAAVNAGDGSNRLFIVEQPGVIRIYQGGSLLATPFLNITDRVNYDFNERGLLSLAFPPNYDSLGHFYVYYTAADGSLTLSRFGLTSANVADPNSEQIVLNIPHSDHANHNGGTLAFGPDGYLYLGTGDGGGAGDTSNNAQNLNVLLGKIIRIDVETGSPATYIVPPSNPLVGISGLDEIWAYGVRNPWRMSFDRLTGDLYIADVGQDAWEEVNVQPAAFSGGANYGWHILEGTHCYNPPTGCSAPTAYVAPVAEYNHGSGDSYGCAITGGYAYRGSAYPSMYGIYFAGDYCTGRVFGMQNVGGSWFFTQLAQPGFNISSFGEDEAGNLYMVDLGGGVYQVVSP